MIDDEDFFDGMEIKPEKPQDSIEINIIDPNEVTSELLDRMNIDIGMRSLIRDLLIHGYNTGYSCEGHGVYAPYVAFKKGTGDGTFEKNAGEFGLELRRPGPCCLSINDNFCSLCDSSIDYVVYRGEKDKPISLIRGQL